MLLAVSVAASFNRKKIFVISNCLNLIHTLGSNFEAPWEIDMIVCNNENSFPPFDPPLSRVGLSRNRNEEARLVGQLGTQFSGNWLVHPRSLLVRRSNVAFRTICLLCLFFVCLSSRLLF